MMKEEGEQRSIEGQLFGGEEAGYPLVDSTAEDHEDLGSAYHLILPRSIVYASRDGEFHDLRLSHESTINISSFSRAHADYDGLFRVNPFALQVEEWKRSSLADEGDSASYRALIAEISGMKSEINSLNGTVDTITDDFTDALGDLQSLQKDVQSIETMGNRVDGLYDYLEEGKDFRQRLDELESLFSSLTTELAAVLPDDLSSRLLTRKDLPASEEEVAAAYRWSAEQSERVETLAAELKDVRQRLDGLREEGLALSDDLRDEGLTLADDLRGEGLALADDLRGEGLALADDLRGEGLALADDLRGERLALADDLRGEGLALADDLRGEGLALADDLRGEGLALADDLRGEGLALADDLRGEGLALADDLRGEGLALADDLRSEGLALADDLRSEGLALADELRRERMSAVGRLEEKQIAAERNLKEDLEEEGLAAVKALRAERSQEVTKLNSKLDRMAEELYAEGAEAMRQIREEYRSLMNQAAGELRKENELLRQQGLALADELLAELDQTADAEELRKLQADLEAQDSQYAADFAALCTEAADLMESYDKKLDTLRRQGLAAVDQLYADGRAAISVEQAAREAGQEEIRNEVAVKLEALDAETDAQFIALEEDMNLNIDQAISGLGDMTELADALDDLSKRQNLLEKQLETRDKVSKTQFEGLYNETDDLQNDFNALSIRNDDLKAKLEDMKKEYGIITEDLGRLRNAVLTFENLGLFGTIRTVSREGIMKILELKNERPNMTQEEAAEILSREGYSLSSYEIFLVFSVYFNEYK